MEHPTEARDKRLKRVLVSMRSMDSARNPPDFPSGGGGGGGGGNRHIRPRSPSYDDLEQHKPRRRSQRRQGDSSTDEIIRFVRGYHLERESTWLRLQKKAPLPSIGQANQTSQEFSFSQCLKERRKSHADSFDDDRYEDFVLDHEVSAIEAGSRQRDPYRHQFEVTDEDFRFAPSRKVGAGSKRHERHVNASYGPPASHHRHGARPGDGHAGSHFSPRAHARKGWGRSLKQLPPIAQNDLPERPSAPSPSLTPPGEGEEELDSAGEPVDFIDTH